MVESTFANRMAELRRQKKISQKEAAGALGISQALLSHYENGIRECGLDFVVRAADYYGVSTDYLLGHSNDIIELNAAQLTEKEDPGDKEMSQKTMFHAVMQIMDKIPEGEERDKMVNLFSFTTYLTLWSGTRRGRISTEWLGDPALSEKQLRFLAMRLSDSAMEKPKTRSRSKKIEPAPDAVKTLCSWMYDVLNTELAELL